MVIAHVHKEVKTIFQVHCIHMDPIVFDLTGGFHYEVLTHEEELAPPLADDPTFDGDVC